MREPAQRDALRLLERGLEQEFARQLAGPVARPVRARERERAVYHVAEPPRIARRRERALGIGSRRNAQDALEERRPRTARDSLQLRHRGRAAARIRGAARRSDGAEERAELVAARVARVELAQHGDPGERKRRERLLAQPEHAARIGERLGKRCGELGTRSVERDRDQRVARRARLRFVDELGLRALEQRGRGVARPVASRCAQER